MEGADFVEAFCGDEGAGGAEVALRDVAAAPDEVVELSFNVWIIHVDRPRGVVHFEHDFLPDEGSMPLADFVEGLRSRLAGR